MDNILYALLYEAIITAIQPTSQLLLKIDRPHRQESNISYTIPISNDHLLLPNNTQFRNIVDFYLTFHEIDETVSGMLVTNLINFIQDVILSFGGDNHQSLNVYFEIEDHNPNASRRLDVEVVIQDLEITQRKATEEEDSKCAICLEDLQGPENINTLFCNHKFHHDCIVTWLHHKTTFPNCRILIV
ncbi:hypothetical protein CARUB_v10015795mg [Capsella rubella]|uniref:RING-type E3 ubiquitin transferase n=1 Tax=Capsella rubella TaxID=81985 RepID=R0I3M0_9BRAS|nr:hypothetical protein CARUB_v10015795mg [Capsella rubella]